MLDTEDSYVSRPTLCPILKANICSFCSPSNQAGQTPCSIAIHVHSVCWHWAKRHQTKFRWLEGQICELSISRRCQIHSHQSAKPASLLEVSSWGPTCGVTTRQTQGFKCHRVKSQVDLCWQRRRMFLFLMPHEFGQGWPWSCVIKDENWPHFLWARSCESSYGGEVLTKGIKTCSSVLQPLNGECSWLWD